MSKKREYHITISDPVVSQYFDDLETSGALQPILLINNSIKMMQLICTIPGALSKPELFLSLAFPFIPPTPDEKKKRLDFLLNDGKSPDIDVEEIFANMNVKTDMENSKKERKIREKSSSPIPSPSTTQTASVPTQANAERKEKEEKEEKSEEAYLKAKADVMDALGMNQTDSTNNAPLANEMDDLPQDVQEKMQKFVF